MFHEQSYNSNEKMPPVIGYRQDLSELKKDIEVNYPEKKIEKLMKEYPNSAWIIQQLREQRENQFSQTFMQGIDWKPWEEELVLLIAKKNSLFALPLFANYKDKPYAQKVVAMAIESAFKESPEVALANMDVYENKEHTRALMDVLFATDKSELLFFYKRLITQAGYGILPWRGKDFVELSDVKSRPWEIKDFFWDFLNHFVWKELHIGQKKIILQFPQHLNLFSGLLKTFDQTSADAQNNPIDRNTIQKTYEENLLSYIAKWVEMAKIEPEHNHVFLIRASKKWWDDYMSYDGKYPIDRHNEWRRTYYNSLTVKENFTDYSSDINPTEPSKIIKHIQKTITHNPDDHIYIHVWFHGRPDGSTPYLWGKNRNRGYEWWGRTKKDYDALLNLKARNPDHIHIDLDSCYSWDKDSNYHDNTILNTSRASWRQLSYATRSTLFLSAFTQRGPISKGSNLSADYDGDGSVNYNEALVYVIENYNQSLTPTTFDYNGNAIDISMVKKEDNVPIG